MGLFDGSAGRQAAMYQLNTLGQGQQQALGTLNQYGAQGANAIQNASNTAQQQATTGYDQALQALGGYQPAYGAINTGYADAQNALTGGYNQARGDLTQALGYYQPYANAGQSGLNMYLNSLGLNGAGGNAAATGAFQAGPGYQWQVDQSLGQTNRAANAAGMLNSGNTLTALQDRANNLANQEYGSWQDRLSGLGGMGLQAASGQAGIAGNMANLAYGYGQGLSGLHTGRASDLSGLHTGEANARAGLASGLGDTLSNLSYRTGADTANLYSGLGGNLANTQTNYTKAIADAGASAYKAKDDAQARQVNALLGIGSSLANLGGTIYGANQLPGIIGAMKKVT